MRKIVSVLLCCLLLASSACAMAENRQAAASARGFGGEVTVTLTVDENGKVIEASAVGDSETPDIGGKAIRELPDAMVTAGTVTVEGVSGATFTSAAVLEAAGAAYAQACGITQEAAAMTPGVYTATIRNYYSTLTVQTEVTEDAIAAVEVTDCVAIRPSYNNLNEATSAPARNNIPQRIVANQTLNIDAITGCTVTSNAILAGVKDCILQAGGDPANFAAPVAKSTAVENYDCDVLVIGCGTAGCMAASSANTAGAKVIVFEKSGKVGGTGAVSAGPSAPGLQLEGQEKATDVNLRFNVWNQMADFSTKGAILYDMLDGAAEAVQYLADHGFAFEGPKNFNNCWHDYNNVLFDMYDFAGRKANNTEWFTKLAYEVEENGGMILLETTGDHLIFDENGKVAGAVGYKADGTTVNVNASAVILSTGGYLGNTEKIVENFGHTYKTIAYLQNDGAGIRMGQEAGGALFHEKTEPIAHMQGTYVEMDPFTFENPSSNYYLHTLTYTPGLMQVNGSGSRYHNEGTLEASCLVESCNDHAAQGDYFYTLLSQNQINTLVESGLRGLGSEKKPFGGSYVGICAEPDEPMTNLVEVLEKGIEIGTVMKGDTLEELAAAAGMTASILTRNVERYNAMCAAGEDTRFGKAARFLNAYEEGPYYAVKGTVYAYNTLGGLNVDEDIHVIREDNSPIEGLYCCGADSIGVIMNATAYPDLGGPNLTWAFYSGYTAGRNAAAEAGK